MRAHATSIVTIAGAALSLLIAGPATGMELRGHGGPVRAIAVASADRAVTGSFDARAIVWSLESGAARAVLDFHESQVDAVVALPGKGLATAGADGRIALWRDGQERPVRILEGHSGPIVTLALSPDGTTLASGSWDATARLWPLSGSRPRVLEGHDGNVNAVGFLSDGTPISAGYDARLIIWPRQHGSAPRQITLPSPANALVVLPGDRIGVGGADGMLRVFGRDGSDHGEVRIGRTPLIALAVSPDGAHVAAAGMERTVEVLRWPELTVRHSLSGPGMPVWALSFTIDGSRLLSGGSDGVVRQWDVVGGSHVGTMAPDRSERPAGDGDDPGARVFRACIACHTLDPAEGTRAGPTLHGLFGRRIASVPGYRYSPALREMDIVWTPATVSRLFEVGPSTYTPGTKMPEQTISRPQDRAALIRFLQEATTTE